MVDVFDMADIETKLSLNRRNLIALAVLVGCDYDQRGVRGVGPGGAVKLVQKCSESGIDMLDRLVLQYMVLIFNYKREACLQIMISSNVVNIFFAFVIIYLV